MLSSHHHPQQNKQLYRSGHDVRDDGHVCRGTIAEEVHIGRPACAKGPQRVDDLLANVEAAALCG